MTPKRPSNFGSYSEFKRHCIERGGVVYLVADFDPQSLERACSEVPFSSACKALNDFAPTERALRRHWPWIAFAASQFEFQSRELSRYRADELSPSEVAALLTKIDKRAKQLADDLCTLQDQANRLDVPGHPVVRAHLQWLDEFLNQAIRGALSPDVDETPEMLWANHNSRMAFLATLARLSAAAEAATTRCDSSLLARRRLQANPAVARFVARLSRVWTSMTDRPSTANKVNGTEDPDFVLFVQAVAGLVGNGVITRPMVETALA